MGIFAVSETQLKSQLIFAFIFFATIWQQSWLCHATFSHFSKKTENIRNAFEWCLFKCYVPPPRLSLDVYYAVAKWFKRSTIDLDWWHNMECSPETAHSFKHFIFPLGKKQQYAKAFFLVSSCGWTKRNELSIPRIRRPRVLWIGGGGGFSSHQDCEAGPYALGPGHDFFLKSEFAPFATFRSQIFLATRSLLKWQRAVFSSCRWWLASEGPSQKHPNTEPSFTDFPPNSACETSRKNKKQVQHVFGPPLFHFIIFHFIHFLSELHFWHKKFFLIYMPVGISLRGPSFQRNSISQPQNQRTFEPNQFFDLPFPLL